jgi:hypothetical protein
VYLGDGVPEPGSALGHFLPCEIGVSSFFGLLTGRKMN